jgi:hypothetical protein
LFLLGMWLMTEGLRLAAGTAMREVLAHSTHAAHHQPDREPERLDRPLHAQRQTLEGRAYDAFRVAASARPCCDGRAAIGWSTACP